MLHGRHHWRAACCSVAVPMSACQTKWSWVLCHSGCRPIMPGHNLGLHCAGLRVSRASSWISPESRTTRFLNCCTQSMLVVQLYIQQCRWTSLDVFKRLDDLRGWSTSVSDHVQPNFLGLRAGVQLLGLWSWPLRTCRRGQSLFWPLRACHIISFKTVVG